MNSIPRNLVETFAMPKISDEAKVTYLKHRREEMEKILEALKRGDWDFIGRIGHKIKGNAETFGFGRLAPVAISLELAAQNKSTEKVFTALNQLEKELEALGVSS